MVRTLRDYQVDAVRALLADVIDTLVEHPTGSGKTLVMVVVASVLATMRRRKVLIATTQEHIESRFTRRDYRMVRCGGKSYTVSDESIRAARDTGAAVATIEAYLASTVPGYALCCTHAALTRVRPPTELPNVGGDVLIVDEAHHAAALGCGFKSLRPHSLSARSSAVRAGAL